MISIAEKLYVLMLMKNKQMKRFKVSDEKGSFTYDRADYNIDPRKIFYYKRKPTLLYFEGYSEPLGFEDISIKGKIVLSAEDIHSFASKRMLKVLAESSTEEKLMNYINIATLVLVVITLIATVVI